ncbi:MAG TPA: hypothetical protein DDW31_03545 [candidate division Zixibacteria bacterium]|jgi:type IV pilus assembly protein PilO|nr:hypothetical protein [candidate division Zixibacteria bacterium]
MNLKDPKIQIAIGLAVLTVAIAVLYVYLGFIPTKKSVEVLSAQETKLRQELEQVRAAVARLPELEAEYQALEKKWAKAQELLPTDKEISRLLKQVTNTGIEAGVKFVTFKPGAPASASALSSSIPIDLSVLGSFDQVAGFMAGLGNLPRIIVPSKLKLTANKDRDDDVRTIKADFTATAYVFKTGGQTSDKQAPRGRR